MRGKHANAAKNRREREDLQQRSEAAEHRAERLAKEMAELRESSQRAISSLRGELAQARKDRDAAVAPRLEEAIKAAERLRKERDSARFAARDLPRRLDSAMRTCVPRLQEAGLTADQIAAVLTLFTKQVKADTFSLGAEVHQLDAQHRVS